MGDLTNISIDQNGTILGAFTNDQILTLAQIVLADFNNPQGLNREGGNLYRVSANTGEAIYGMPQNNFGSTIFSGYVEMSNVDLSKQFADMIVAQRGFQASARIVTTVDRMLEEITRLKRM
jgi:flagellar hook protein FlgE